MPKSCTGSIDTKLLRAEKVGTSGTGGRVCGTWPVGSASGRCLIFSITFEVKMLFGNHTRALR